LRAHDQEAGSRPAHVPSGLDAFPGGLALHTFNTESGQRFWRAGCIMWIGVSVVVHSCYSRGEKR
jgi:hypothetical protein